MSKKVYDSLMRGLNEAIEDAKSEQKTLKRQTISIEPIKEYKASEIKQIRKDVNMTQSSFAGYLGVSNKTVEAWESGKNQPSGAASRILSMLEMDHNLPNIFQFVKRR